MTLDIAKIRAQTPGAERSAHLLACGSALMPQCVVDAVVDHTRLEAEIGGYEAAADQAALLDGVYADIARLINATAREIALVENASVGWMQAFYALRFEPGDRIITCEAEYGSNFVSYLQRAKRDGIEIDICPSDEHGVIDLDAMEALVTPRTRLIAITWIPTNGGLMNPAAKVGALAKAHDIPYLLDGCQAIGQTPVDVKALGCDFFSATGRKFLRGPRGTGFLYIAEKWLETLEPSMLDFFGAVWTSPTEYTLRDDARRFETWENAYALRAGLGVAARYAVNVGIEAIGARAFALADQFRAALADIPGARLRDLGRETGIDRCAIVSFTVDGLAPAQTVAALRTKGVAIGTSSREGALVDATARNLPLLMRAAPHYYNTEDEIDLLARELQALAKA